MRELNRKFAAAGIATAILFTGAVTPAHAAVHDMDAVSLAKRYIGKEYTKGGETPSAGFNASGLIYYVLDKLDYDVPRSLDAQYKMEGASIKSTKSLKYGDVLFFGKDGDPSYGGIYIGGGYFVMASQSADEVVRRKLSSYTNSFIGARRVLTVADHARAKVVITAREYLGTPYVFGAKYGQTRTFDCSSFTKTVLNEIGITLPRVSRNQSKKGTYVKKSDLKVGDLVFFTTDRTGDEIGHVGIYVGNGEMIHTYGDGGVKYTPIDKDYWENRYVTARRFIGN